jgi:hypothetical protein
MNSKFNTGAPIDSSKLSIEDKAQAFKVCYFLLPHFL